MFIFLNAFLACASLTFSLKTGESAEEFRHLNAEELRQLHGKMDYDNDGKVSLQEVTFFANNYAQNTAFQAAHKFLQEGGASKDKEKLTKDEHDTHIHEQAAYLHKDDERGIQHHKAVESAKFHAADADKDGILNITELPTYFFPETHPEVLDAAVNAHMKVWDSNGDGKLTYDEFWGGLHTEADKESFDALDVNKDGSIDAQEMRVMESGTFADEPTLKQLLEMSDHNKDAHITADELAATANKFVDTHVGLHLHTLKKWADEL